MEKLFETHYAYIEHDNKNDLIFLKMKNVVEHEEYKTMFLTVLEKFVEKKCYRLLVDQSDVQKSSMESRAWLVTKWIPMVRQEIGENAKCAVVLARNMFSKIGAQYVVGLVGTITRLDIKSFSNHEDAMHWLVED
ncbi:MAG: STAS/SEC14 domain-containing protein [Cytophagales bacterium]|nr:MAG: STAS/SEC14 domain-containing protein [Cytophagales bacterium]